MRRQVISKAEWNRIKAHHGPGTKVTAVVRRHVGFGAICDIGAGRISATVRNIEIDWDPAKQNSSTIPEGSFFDAAVLGFEDEWRELIISRKAAQPTPFEKYIVAHKVGDIVEGEVHEITAWAVILRLSGGLEGLIPHELIPKITPPPGEPDLNWRLTKGDHVKALIVGYDQAKLAVRLDLAAAVQKINEKRKNDIQAWRRGESVAVERIDTVTSAAYEISSSKVSERLTVLVVDDEPNICFPVASALQDRGHRVITANLLFDARKKLDSITSLDVALIDQQLPDGSGLDLLLQIEQSFPLCRMILFTGNPGSVQNRDLGRASVLVKPLEMSKVVVAVEDGGGSYVDHRVLVGEESLGEISRLTAPEIERMNSQVRQVLDNYLSALQEPFGKAKIAILRLQESTNRVECLRSLDANPAVFERYRDTLRFSFIGRVLEGDDSGFHPLHRASFTPEGKEPLRPLLKDLNSETIYGQQLHVESQTDPLAVFAFMGQSDGQVDQSDIRDFSQTAKALSLAIERATLDSQLFKHQRVMVAGGVLLGMGHELRNQVQSLTSLSEYESYDFAVNDLASARRTLLEVQKDMQDIREHAGQIRDILESVLNLTRNRRHQRVTLVSLLKLVIQQCDRTAKTDEIYIHLEASDRNLSYMVSSALQHVLMNLILNSIQHVRLIRDHKCGFVKIRLKRHENDGSPEMLIYVEDNAFGIDWSSRSRIFAPFVTTRSHGTGLGLSVARMIAESEGGQLEVDSSFKFIGTTVVLRVPVSEVSDD